MTSDKQLKHDWYVDDVFQNSLNLFTNRPVLFKTKHLEYDLEKILGISGELDIVFRDPEDYHIIEVKSSPYMEGRARQQLMRAREAWKYITGQWPVLHYTHPVIGGYHTKVIK